MTMRTTLGSGAMIAALLFLGLAAAQPPAPSLEERVAALEGQFASLDTRFALQSARPLGGESGITLVARVTEIERSIERLANDVQRVERLADSAAREAAQAARVAMTAEQTARDVALRPR
jgi:hypothetical protein